MNDVGLCKRCKKDVIWIERSKSHCKRCFEYVDEVRRRHNALHKDADKARRKKLASEAKSKGLCVACFSRPIFRERSENYCEPCLCNRHNANHRYNETHRKENYERTKRWIENNRERARAYKREWMRGKYHLRRDWQREYRKTSEKYKAWKTQYAIENGERMRLKTLEWQANNPDRVRENRQRFYKAHPGIQIEYMRRWRSGHRTAVCRLTHERRARLDKVDGTFTDQEWDDLLERYGHRCLACGSKENITQDHIVPISKGGSNNIDNMQPLCLSCNSRKNARTIDYRVGFDMVRDWT